MPFIPGMGMFFKLSKVETRDSLSFPQSKPDDGDSGTKSLLDFSTLNLRKGTRIKNLIDRMRNDFRLQLLDFLTD